MLEVEERFELLQDQVDVLSLKLRESNKWQKALEKWLRNTFKLDVSELVRNDALKSGDNYQDYDEDDGLVYGAEISVTSPEPPTKTNTNDRKRKAISNLGSVQIPKPQPGFLPPLHRIITTANNQPQVQTTTSSSTVSIHQSQRQMTAITTATNTSMLRSRVKAKVVPRRVTQNNNSLRPRLDPPTVSITALPPTPEESDFSPNTILILPTEKVSSFCDEDTEIHENPNQRLNLNEYDDEIQIMETRSIIKDEDPQHSSTRSSFGVTDESNSHYDERRSGSEENGNIDSHVIPSTSQNKLEFDDFYMFNIRGYENPTSQSKSDSEMDINNPKHLYENVVEEPSRPPSSPVGDIRKVESYAHELADLQQHEIQHQQSPSEVRNHLEEPLQALERSLEDNPTLRRSNRKGPRSCCFPCEFCEIIFTRKWTLNRHVETIHDNKRVSCTTCSKEFLRNDILVKHLRNVHGIVTLQ